MDTDFEYSLSLKPIAKSKAKREAPPFPLLPPVQKIFLQEQTEITEGWNILAITYEIAAFHVDNANGFSDIVINEHYEIILDALGARNVVHDTLLDRALGDIQALLERYFIPRSVKAWADCYANLENTNRLGAFKSEIEDLDRRYFEGSPSLWGDCDEYIERARKYACSKRDNLSIRRGEEVGDGDAEEAI